MLKKILVFVLFLNACIASEIIKSKNNKYLVNVPVLNMHKKCSEKSSYVSQAIYGHMVYIIKKISNQWALIETEDGYNGYAKITNLIKDNPVYRTSQRKGVIKSLNSLIYPVADLTKAPPILKLPFSSRIVLEKDFDSNQDRWLKVELIDGSKGWIQRGDVEKPTQKSFQQVIEKAFTFLERPYIWGGTSSDGFDCSGFVQTLCKQMGYLLPRDSKPQAESDLVFKVNRSNLKFGDLIFLNQKPSDHKFDHIGIYINDGNFIHTGVLNHKPKTQLENLNTTKYFYITARRLKKLTFDAKVYKIDHKILKKISFSWKDNNPVGLNDLRYITLKHFGYDGCVHDGEIVVHKSVVKDVIEIFKELFEQKYPIEKMILIDSYEANDTLSCEDNNSSAFCSRYTVGKNEWSYHSYGLAIDINPLLNPYKKRNLIIPENGKIFLDRSLDCIGIITKNDLCYKAFTSRGWKWGGDFENDRGYVDYQHFYKEL